MLLALCSLGTRDAPAFHIFSFLLITVGSLTVDDVLRVLGFLGSAAGEDEVAVNISAASPEPLGGNAATATTTTTIFDVEGMTCASCAASLESVIAQLPGVCGARVNLLTRTATVERNPEVVSWILL